jgi:diacylglycerol kinase (ATP)
VMLCAVANAISYGGAMKIAPMAKIDDGLIDVVIVEETSLFEFLMTFPKVFKGTHMSHPKVQHFTAKTITIESATRSTLLADGELYASTPATFSIIESAVPVIVPENFEAIMLANGARPDSRDAFGPRTSRPATQQLQNDA